QDIGTWPGPRLEEVGARMRDKVLAAEAETLSGKIQETTRAIELSKQRQLVLRDSTSNSERTMNQLLELQKVNLQKGGSVSATDSQTLAESQRLFLANQSKYQEMNDQISSLSQELASMQDR